MLRFVSDENFNNQIVRGLLRRNLDVDIVRVQDVGLSQTDDRIILEWAAQQKRITLTHVTQLVWQLKRFCYVPKRVSQGNGKDKSFTFLLVKGMTSRPGQTLGTSSCSLQSSLLP